MADRSARIGCVNNLRLIGRAFQLWSGDHEGENPWRSILEIEKRFG